MTLRSFRVADDVWMAALARAKSDGTTLTAVLTEALAGYGSGTPAAVVSARPTLRADSPVSPRRPSPTRESHAESEPCRHPLFRRVGTACTACGKTVK